MRFKFSIRHKLLFGEHLQVRLSAKQHPALTEDLTCIGDDLWQSDAPIAFDHRKSELSILHCSPEASPRLLWRKKISCDFEEAMIRVDLHAETGYEKIFRRKPFRRTFLPGKTEPKNAVKRPTHTLHVNSPRLQDGFSLCMSGASPELGAWDKRKPLFAKAKKDGSVVFELALSETGIPVGYKFCLFNHAIGEITEYEPGDNRALIFAGLPELIFCSIVFEKFLWKAAGVNVPLFSLRTEKSCGCGDLSDLLSLVDFAADAGLQLIQLLPINDCSSSFTRKDSYPYSAISAFAIDAKYLDVVGLASAYGFEIGDARFEKLRLLNQLTAVKHAEVVLIKLEIARDVFDSSAPAIRADKSFARFQKKNRSWLAGYTSFCFLRDRFGTSDFAGWSEFSIYRKDEQKVLCEQFETAADDLLYWAFLQYQLHQQLATASGYARRKGVALKADFPIGIGLFSADTRQHPELFHLDMQAGAPPDAFSDDGQNWKFPTYDYPAMEADNYRWFRRRLRHLEKYFDALRLDHVLGFFRIWTIPRPQHSGIFGRFVPAQGFSATELEQAGIAFSEERFCKPFTAGSATDFLMIKSADGYHFRINLQQTNSFRALTSDEQERVNKLYQQYFFTRQNNEWERRGRGILNEIAAGTDMLLCAEDLGMVPDFTESVLHETGILGLQVTEMPKQDHEIFSNPTAASYRSVLMPATHDMPPVRLWWKQQPEVSAAFARDILDAQSIVGDPAAEVCRQIISNHLSSPAMLAVFLLQDLLSTEPAFRVKDPARERINDPANENQDWNYRMPMTIEKLRAHTAFTKRLETMVRESGRK